MSEAQLNSAQYFATTRDAKARANLLFSFRTLKCFIVWLISWQESLVGGSPLQLDQFIHMPFGMYLSEAVLLLFALILILERTLIGDYTIKRSYFYGPLLVIMTALIFSWARGAWINQSIKPVFEAHEAIRTPIAFFLVLNAFRDKGDGRTLITLILLGGLAKAFDGAAIYFFSGDPAKGWGVVQMWRDGFLLAFVLTGLLILMQYQGTRYRWLRKLVIVGSPLAFFTMIVSYRRTFFIGLLVASFGLFFTLGKGRRRRHGFIVLGMLFAFAVIVLLTDPIAFATRFLGVIDPSAEGSAYIRLMELPNVLKNIQQNPIWGVPIGTQWHQYYRMPLFANFTSLGTHNTYLYWQLRTGIMGSIGFFWLLTRMWRAAIMERVMAHTEDQFLFAQFSIYLIVIYMVGCAFGIMYGDAMNSMLAFILAALQIQFQERTGLTSLKHVAVYQSFKAKRVIFHRQ